MGKRSPAPTRATPRFLYGLVLALLLVAAVTAGCASAGRGSGLPDPDLLLGTLEGETRLSDLRGRPLVLYFSFPG